MNIHWNLMNMKEWGSLVHTVIGIRSSQLNQFLGMIYTTKSSMTGKLT